MKHNMRGAAVSLLRLKAQASDSVIRLNEPDDAHSLAESSHECNSFAHDYPPPQLDSASLPTKDSADTPKSSELADRHVELDEEARYPSKWKLTGIIVGLGFAVFCMALDGTILATAIPKITAEFDSLDEMAWYASAYLLAICSMTLVFGKLYTIFSVKWTFLCTLTLFETGSLICGAAPSSLILIIGRAVAGIGGAGLFLGSMLIISEILPLEKRSIFTSMISGLYGIAGVIGPLMGGAFTDYVSWRWCFYINLPFGGVTAFIILFFLKTKPGEKKSKDNIVDRLLEMDLIGNALLLPAIICLLLVLQWAGTKHPWNDGHIIALLIVFGVLTLGFAGVQHWRQDRATIPPRIIKNRNVLGLVLFTFFISGSFVIFTYYLPIWFQSIKNASATGSGIMCLPMILGSVILSLLSGYAVSVVGYYNPFLYSTPIVASIGAGLLSSLQVDSGPGLWISYQLILGIGLGTGIALPSALVQSAVAVEDIASSVALIAFTQTLSSALFNFVAQSVFQNQLVHLISLAAPDLDVKKVTESGVTMLRSVVPAEMLSTVLRAYNSAIMHALYVGVALAVLAIFGTLPLQWLSVKGKKSERGVV